MSVYNSTFILILNELNERSDIEKVPIDNSDNDLKYISHEQQQKKDL